MKNNLFFEKNKYPLIIAILFLVWISFLLLIIFPEKDSLHNKFVDLEKEKLNNQANNEKLSSLGDLKRISGLLDSEKKNLEVIFSEDKIIDLVDELEKIAEEVGGEISISVASEEGRKIETVNVSKDEKREEDFLKNLPTQNYFEIDITLEGDYNKTLNFIKKINSIKYYNVIKSFEMGMQERSLNKSDRVVGGGGVTNLSQDENSNENSLPEEKFFLESKLKVLFYLMGNKDEKK
ncbi:MAG: hypothetical protein EOM84_00005 [Sphingobacteriia bacterium]|jgi:hypothetical protein|nr:hypothetical protein [Sphingobacteriia bacterium]